MGKFCQVWKTFWMCCEKAHTSHQHCWRASCRTLHASEGSPIAGRSYSAAQRKIQVSELQKHMGLWGFSLLCYTPVYWYSLIASGISELHRDFCKWSRLNDVCPRLNTLRQTTDKGPTSLTSIHGCAVITIQPQPLGYNFSETRNAH